MLRSIVLLTTFAAIFIAAAAAQPTIASGGILNSASNAFPGLPNSSIAQGSIFVMYGTGMGPSALVEATTFPIPTTLAGTSVSVTAGGQTLPAPMIYTSAGQVAAILPSATPAGSAMVTVSYQGATSAPQSLQVVSSSFGSYSLNQKGNGSGIITNAKYQVFLAGSAALAGDPAILWGTGLGPVSSDVNPPTVANLNVPVKVYVGSQLAQVSYQGRSGCCSGLDQIVFTVPNGVTGCSVPVVVVTNGDTASNTTTMPIGDDASRVCSDPTGLTAAQVGLLQSKGSLKLGYVDLTRISSSNSLLAALGEGPSTTDSGSATFVEFTPSTFAGATFGFQVASVGSCLVYNFSSANTASTPTITLPLGLDAGASIDVSGPNGAKQLTEILQTKGSYSATLSSGTPPNTTLYLSPGAYTIDGSGGADVGAFTVNLTVPQPLTWTNMNALVATPINRASGVTLDWTGGAPGSYVSISGTSLMVDATGMSGVFALFTCLAPVAAGSFTVGPNVLLQLPASSTITEDGVSFSFSALSIGNAPLPVQFTAPGLDYGFATSNVSISTGVTYQ